MLSLIPLCTTRWCSKSVSPPVNMRGCGNANKEADCKRTGILVNWMANNDSGNLIITSMKFRKKKLCLVAKKINDKISKTSPTDELSIAGDSSWRVKE